jgi:hypothetical protein
MLTTAFDAIRLTLVGLFHSLLHAGLSRRTDSAIKRSSTLAHKSHAWIVDSPSGVGTQDRPTSFLPRLKNGKVIGVVDEDAPEEPRRQDAVDPLETGILVDAGETEEGHAWQFD